MTRLKFWIGGVLVALATTGIALAAGPDGASTDAASATFRAEAKRVTTRNCKGSDGTYRITRGIYAGTMESSDPRLNGRLRIRIHSVYNTDEKLGWAHGVVHVRGEETRAAARLSAVLSDDSMEGLLTGAAGAPRAKLLANFSADFTPDGFSGKLGSGDSANLALLFTRGCKSESSETAIKQRERPKEREAPQAKERRG